MDWPAWTTLLAFALFALGLTLNVHGGWQLVEHGRWRLLLGCLLGSAAAAWFGVDLLLHGYIHGL